jgi:hypothetical protein
MAYENKIQKLRIYCVTFYFSHKQKIKTKNLNSVACSPQANYTDRAAAACWRSQCQPLRIEGVAWSAQRIPAAVNLSFQDRTKRK